MLPVAPPTSTVLWRVDRLRISVMLTKDLISREIGLLRQQLTAERLCLYGKSFSGLFDGFIRSKSEFVWIN